MASVVSGSFNKAYNKTVQSLCCIVEGKLKTATWLGVMRNSAGENYYGTYRSTFVRGSRTVWGWVKFFEELVTFGIHGIVGANIFHKIYIKRRKV